MCSSSPARFRGRCAPNGCDEVHHAVPEHEVSGVVTEGAGRLLVE